MSVLLSRRALFCTIVTALSTVWACGSHSLAPAAIPETRVAAGALQLELRDPRGDVSKPSLPPQQMEHNEETVRPRAVPKSALTTAQGRLDQIVSGAGPKLRVIASVERADVTFRNNGRDEFTRFDVVFAVRVENESRGLVLKGTGAAFNELDSRDATLAEQARFMDATVIHALDQLFADESVLERINQELSKQAR